MAGSIREMSSEMDDNHGNFDLLDWIRVYAYKLVYAPKSHKIEYMPMHTIRVITGLA